jgi:hypothetical protein
MSSIPIHQFYNKTGQIIVNSRINSEYKINKWFNLATKDNEQLKLILKQYSTPQPLTVDIYHKNVILESWQLSFVDDEREIETHSTYKKCVVFFRTLYNATLLLPASTLKDLRYTIASSRSLDQNTVGFNKNVSELNLGTVVFPQGYSLVPLMH